MFEKDEKSDIDRVLVFYDDLIRGNDTSDAIEVLDDLANQGNLYAAYVLGSCYIFGMPPRHYDFNRVYSDDQFNENELVPRDEQKAFGYYFQLLNFGDEVEQYQLEAVYDFYRILKGSSPIFKQFNLELRPKPGDAPNDFTVLFDSTDELLNLLKEFDYFESYIDIAKHFIQLFNSSANKEHLDTAVLYLNKILKPEGRIFSKTDDLQATLQYINIYLIGNAHISADPAMAISLALKSESDQALVVILDYFEANGITDPLELEPILTRIVDNGIRFEQRNRFNLPYAIKPTDRLAKMWSLFGVKTPIMSDIYQSTSTAEKALLVDQASEEPESETDNQNDSENTEGQLSPEDIAFSAEQAQNSIRMLLSMGGGDEDQDSTDDDYGVRSSDEDVFDNVDEYADNFEDDDLNSYVD